jgi:hypothetical protein
MAAGKHGSSEITVSYDDALGTPVVLTCFLLTMGPVKISSNMQAGTTFCDIIEKQLPTGMSKIEPIKLTGFFDDSVGGPHPTFKKIDTNPQGATRTLTINFGNSNQWQSEGYCQAYSVIANQGNLTGFEADLVQNSGAWTP